MSIEFSEDTVGLWYVPSHMRDWMCGLSRAGDEFKIQYRFRYYEHPTDAWDGKDRKSWYEATVGGESREEVLAKFRELAALLAIKFGDGIVYELVRGLDESFDSFVERFQALPFIHKRDVSAEEYASLGSQNNMRTQ